ncbi:MAG: hypothetical protein HY689_01910 [Chloroflexi bacterium]|nr:hypothetical protein [Chloroflexota bacterium]
MQIALRADTYLVTLTNDERSMLIWALEAGRALLLGDPDLAVLAADDQMDVEVLDDLADRLFVAGLPPR